MANVIALYHLSIILQTFSMILHQVKRYYSKIGLTSPSSALLILSTKPGAASTILTNFDML